MKAPRITLFATTRCPHCRRLAEWLKAQGLGYRELLVDRDLGARRRFDKLGGRAVPLLVVGDEVITRPDPRRLARHPALAPHLARKPRNEKGARRPPR